jgi:hypothetical protein
MMGNSMNAIDQKKKYEINVGPIGFIEEKYQNKRYDKSCIRNA